MHRCKTKMIVFAVLVLASCAKKGDPAEEARKEAEALDKATNAPKPAAVVKSPVQNEARIPCSNLLPDPAVFQTALGEKDPITVNDVTKQDAEAASSCTLLKGGAKLTAKQQEALSKKGGGRVGVIPGDPLCNITAYCWTVETKERFEQRCTQKGNTLDTTSMSGTACVQRIEQGADDVFAYEFLDDDSKCVISTRGMTNTNNDQILACARTARDVIGPANLNPEAAPPAADPAAAPAADGGT